jgi:hypothetical protein
MRNRIAKYFPPTGETASSEETTAEAQRLTAAEWQMQLSVVARVIVHAATECDTQPGCAMRLLSEQGAPEGWDDEDTEHVSRVAWLASACARLQQEFGEEVYRAAHAMIPALLLAGLPCRCAPGG